MKETFKLFLKNSIEEKQKLLVSNSISDEDKALIQEQIDNLNSMVEKIDALEEGEQANEAIEELKTTLAEMGEKLQAINEKLQQKDNNEDNEEIENEMEYLKTKNSVSDFVNAIRNSRNGEELRANWGEMLVKNGISFESGEEFAYTPDYVRSKIEDLWQKGASWLADLNMTGAKRFVVRTNNSEDSAEGSRAKGWTRGKTKVSQELVFGAKTIDAQFIYKLMDVDKQTEWEDDGSLLDYILEELVNQLLAEERRAILVGDGRALDSDYKINSFEAIAKSTSDVWTTVTTASADFLIDDIRAAVDTIENEENGDIYMYISKADFRTLARVQASETSTPIYLEDSQVADMCGVTKIFKTDLVGGESDYVALFMKPKAYALVGTNVLNPELTSQHNIYSNNTAFRVECPAGGGIAKLKSTAVLKKA